MKLELSKELFNFLNSSHSNSDLNYLSRFRISLSQLFWVNTQQALEDVSGGGQIRPELVEVVGQGHDEHLDALVLVQLHQPLVLRHDDERLLAT